MKALQAFPRSPQSFGIWLNIGSLALMGDDGTLINRSLLFDPAGTLRAYYDKIHLFDVDLPTGESLRESHAYSGGSRAVVLDAAGYRLGLTICYDMRFPGLYRHLAQAGAEAASPCPRPSLSQLAKPTGMCCCGPGRSRQEASFLRPRRAGRHESGRETYGHSLGGLTLGRGTGRSRTRTPASLSSISTSRR